MEKLKVLEETFVGFVSKIAGLVGDNKTKMTEKDVAEIRALVKSHQGMSLETVHENSLPTVVGKSPASVAAEAFKEVEKNEEN